MGKIMMLIETRELDWWLLTLVGHLDGSIIQCFYSDVLGKEEVNLSASTGILQCMFELTPSAPPRLASAPLPPETTTTFREPPVGPEKL